MRDYFPQEFQIAHFAVTLRLLEFTIKFVLTETSHTVQFDNFLLFGQAHVLPQYVHSDVETFLEARKHLLVGATCQKPTESAEKQTKFLSGDHHLPYISYNYHTNYTLQ